MAWCKSSSMSFILIKIGEFVGTKMGRQSLAIATPNGDLLALCQRNAVNLLL